MLVHSELPSRINIYMRMSHAIAGHNGVFCTNTSCASGVPDCQYKFLDSGRKSMLARSPLLLLAGAFFIMEIQNA